MTVVSPSSFFLSPPEKPVGRAPWLESVLGLAAGESEIAELCGDRLRAEVTEAVAAGTTLVTVTIPEARQLETKPFVEAAAAAYDLLCARLDGWIPARFWNHIPCIHDPAGDRLDRYMAFNLGRRAGLRRWFGPGKAFTSRIATATGIGHRGDDLVIHALGWRGRVTHVENPRQRPAYRYSRRYGPASPSFARATWIEGIPSGDLLAVGGTASIRGEDTIAPNDLAAQVDETLTNLDSLVAAAGAAEIGRGLAAFSEVRIFHARPEDEAALRKALIPAFENATRIDFQRADICRRELLVEIEGVVGPIARRRHGEDL